MPRDPIPNSPAPDMMAAMLHDLADTQQRQRQCGQALRALAALTDAADSSAPPRAKIRWAICLLGDG